MTCKTGQMSVLASVRPCGVNNFKKPKAPRPLGRRRWHLTRILHMSWDKTSRKRNFEFRSTCRARSPRTSPGPERWPTPTRVLIQLNYASDKTRIIGRIEENDNYYLAWHHAIDWCRCSPCSRSCEIAHTGEWQKQMAQVMSLSGVKENSHWWTRKKSELGTRFNDSSAGCWRSSWPSVCLHWWRVRMDDCSTPTYTQRAAFSVSWRLADLGPCTGGQ